tara:strand:+ start:192 stop:2024 length:1833 start_codon:yes stop_codon:yes gene_type:complete
MARERLLFEFDGDASKFKQAVKQSEKSVSGFSSNLAKVGGVIAGVFAVDKIMEFGSGVIETTATFQRFESVLTNTLGSTSEAQRALDRITDFASKTPFSVSELTDSFVRLANQGFKPTSEEMRKLGDLASSTGKEFVMLTEAIIDAQVGEFERLKEFGIRASKQGDQVTFTFKNVKTQVDFTSDAIQNYILSLGDLKGVSGAMVGISNTLGGQISNLGDSFDKMKDTIGDALMPVLTSVINKFKGLFEMITDLLNPNQALIDDFKEAKDAVDNLEEASFALSETQRKLVEVTNERKRQRLAELENQISKETENLSSKIERQGEVLDIENQKLKKLSDLLVELDGNQNTTAKNLEFQTDRFLEQNEVVREAQKEFDNLNKELSEFNRKVQEIKTPTQELSKTTQQITLDSTNYSNSLKKETVPLTTQLSESLNVANLKYREMLPVVEDTAKTQQQFAMATNIVTSGMNLMFDALSNPDAFDSFLKSVKQIIVQLLKQLAIMVAIAGVMALVSGGSMSFGKAFKKLLGIGGGGGSGGGLGGVLGFAEGGIVTKPVMGMIGEAGQSEAVIPLNRLPQMIGNIGGNQKGEFTLRGQDLILALERAGDFRARITG